MNPQVQENVRLATPGQKRELQLAITRAFWPVADTLSFGDAEALAKNPKRLQEMMRSGLTPSLKIQLDLYSPFAKFNMWEYRKQDQLANRLSGEWWWDPDQIELSVVPDEYEDRFTRNWYPKILQELLHRYLLPGSAIIDFLHANHHLIPVEWIGKSIYFLGDMYWDGKYGGRHALVMTPDPSRLNVLNVEHVSMERTGLSPGCLVPVIKKQH